jgi:magnesium chelatase family protein
MEFSVVYSRAMAGIDAPLVRVESHLSGGLPAFHIVGLPETAVRESKDRVRSALLNSHFNFPDRRITVNLSPADLPKEGGRFDLPIALGILAASAQVPPQQFAQHEFLGELALDGTLRPVPGVIPAALAARDAGRRLVVPAECAPQAACVPGSEIIPGQDLLLLCAHLNGSQPIAPASCAPQPDVGEYPDLRDVVGQQLALRALEIAASGGHNLLLYGPPGTGKTLLATRLPGILPPPSREEALTGLALRSFHERNAALDSFRRPFRNPHHSASAAALAGGGGRPLPGEMSLAHGGVLFLDELPEFSRHSLEVLRQPLESGEIILSRARHKVRYPASFQLVAAMNPCPCGYLGDSERACRCSPDQVQRYRSRISGPLLDRIDLHVPVLRLPPSALLDPAGTNESSRAVRERVSRCRERQLHRQGCPNAALSAEALAALCRLGRAEKARLETAMNTLHLSARGLHRALRVARTIADMAGADPVGEEHVSEALAYRGLDAGR